jgi:hypothetical protein
MNDPHLCNTGGYKYIKHNNPKIINRKNKLTFIINGFKFVTQYVIHIKTQLKVCYE